MEIKADIAVIGAGLAGVSAAIEAASQGKRVLVVHQAAGATALSSGAWDLADLPYRVDQTPVAEFNSIEHNLEEILRRARFHPYLNMAHRLGHGAFLDFLRQSVEQLRGALPLKMVGNLQQNRLHITAFGTLKPTAVVQASMMEGDLSSFNQAKVLIVGLKGFVPFRSRFLREAMLEFQASQLLPYLQFVGNIDLELPGMENQTSLSAFEIAAALDQEERFVQFAQQLLNYIQGKVYTHVLLPPVMGLVNSELIIRGIQKITGLRVAETLATTPSVPGYRLNLALKQALKNKNITQIEGNIFQVKVRGRSIYQIEVRGEETKAIEAKAYVLASGKFIGKGIKYSIKFVDPLFQIPLFDGKDWVKEKSSINFTHSPSSEAQSLFKIGFQTNEALQPLNSHHEVAFDNLFAAGSVLASYDYVHERSGSGVAISTGAYAAQMASSV